MEITNLVEKNPSLLRLGLHLEFNDARHRVAAHLQRNIDRSKLAVLFGSSSSSRNIRRLSALVITTFAAPLVRLANVPIPLFPFANIVRYIRTCLGLYLSNNSCCCVPYSRLGELQQGTLASNASSPSSHPSASASASVSETASQSPADISPSKAKSLAAFEQFVKARSWTNATDSAHVSSSGRIVRNLQVGATAASPAASGVAGEASTSASAALELLRAGNEKEI